MKQSRSVQGGSRHVAKKETQRLTGMRRWMSILGLFHYLLGFLLILMILLASMLGVRALGTAFREQAGSTFFAFVSSWDETLLGVLFILTMLGRVAMEFVIGWLWRRKARSTVSQTLGLILSGWRTLSALYAIVNGGILMARWPNIYSLILNGGTFALALWMHLEYRKTKLPAERNEQET